MALPASGTEPNPIVPGLISLLGLLPHARLLDLARLFGCDVKQPRANSARLAAHLWLHLEGNVAMLLAELNRDELRLACRQYGLEDTSMRRSELSALILIAAHLDPSRSVHPLETDHFGIPREGQVLTARNRQWLVTKITPGDCHAPPLIGLSCMDDDDPGREIDILWHLELGAKIVVPSMAQLRILTPLDQPSSFGAYLDALKWSASAASDLSNSPTINGREDEAMALAASQSGSARKVPTPPRVSQSDGTRDDSFGSRPTSRDNVADCNPPGHDPIAEQPVFHRPNSASVTRVRRRIHIELALQHVDDVWSMSEVRYERDLGPAAPSSARGLGFGDPTELVLAQKLARYTELCAPPSGQGRLPFIHLQQRLLSSPEAFARSLNAHARALFANDGSAALAKRLNRAMTFHSDRNESGGVDVNVEVNDAATSLTASPANAIPSAQTEGDTLLAEMRSLSAKTRRNPDAKTIAILHWLRENLCAAIGLAPETGIRGQWTARRVIFFTEFADTMRYLVESLTRAARYTEDPKQRILQLHGGMGDTLRRGIQHAFNGPIQAHPVRILVATDSAIAGLNLQNNRPDLFHLDIPWNPHRLHQRDGYNDCASQNSDAVRCHYFIYPMRTEDRVLQTVVRRLCNASGEDDSAVATLYDQIESKLSNGLTHETIELLDAISQDDDGGTVVRSDSVANPYRSDATVSEAPRHRHAQSKLEVSPESLRHVVDVGLKLACLNGLILSGETIDNHQTFTLPGLDRSWDATLDTLRPSRGIEEPFWQWRKRQPRTVTFYPMTGLVEGPARLNMAHPFVKRVLDQYLVHGLGTQHVSRVTAVLARDAAAVRIVGFARLTLFGTGAIRLHDEIVPIAATWSGDDEEISICRDPAVSKATITAAELLLVDNSAAPDASTSRRIERHVEKLFGKLWPHLAADAEGLGTEIASSLSQRDQCHTESSTSVRRHPCSARTAARSSLRHCPAPDLPRETKNCLAWDATGYPDVQRDIAELGTASARILGNSRGRLKMIRVSPMGMIVVWPESMR